jgi:hypothetical protein
MCIDKQGLPILLTRYAIAPKEASAPRVFGSVIELGSEAHYTQRLLRRGFVYMYNETLKKWRGYIVLHNAYLMPFDIDDDGPQYTPVTGCSAKKEAPCEPEKDGALASCITIPYSELGVLWFAYSNVEWTQEVWRKHNDNDIGKDGIPWRTKNMRKVDAKAWRNGTEAAHITGIHKIAQFVSEYSPGVNRKEFRFSPDPFIERPFIVDFKPLGVQMGIPAPAPFTISGSSALVAGLMKAPGGRDFYEQMVLFGNKNRISMNSLLANRQEGMALGLFQGLARLDPDNKLPTDKKGMIVALDDPAGITADLAALVNARVIAFDAPYDRANTASNGISSLRRVVENRALHKLREQAVARQIRLDDMKFRNGEWHKLHHIPRTQQEQQVEDQEQLEIHELISPAGQEKVKAEAWKKYELVDVDKPRTDKKNWRYDEGARRDFEKNYTEKRNAFFESRIAPLSRAHAVWIKSSDLANSFQCNYDDNDIGSGLTYCTEFSNCVGYSQNLTASNKVFTDWLDLAASPDPITPLPLDPSNLLVQALFLNNKGIFKTVNEVVIDNVEKKYKDHINDALAEGGKQEEADTLLLHLLSLVINPVIVSGQGGRLKRLMAGLGLVGRFEIKYHLISGTPKQITRSLATKMLDAVGENRNRRAHMVKQSEVMVNSIFAKNMANAEGKFEVSVLIDEHKLGQLDKKLVQGAETEERAREIRRAATVKPGKYDAPGQYTTGAYTLEEVDEINRARWNKVVKFHAEGVSTLASTAFIVLEAWALADAFKAIETATQQNQDICKPVSDIVAGITGTLSAVAKTGEMATKLMLTQLGKAASDRWIAIFRGAAKWLGSPGAVITGVFSIIGLVEAGAKGQVGLAIAYFGSAVLSGVALWMIWTTATLSLPFIAAVVVATVVVTLLINFLKDDEIQEWLGKCFYGTAPVKDKFGQGTTGAIFEQRALEALGQ